MPNAHATRPTDPPAPPHLVLRPGTVDEAVALIEAAAAAGSSVLVVDLPTGGVVLGHTGQA